MSIQSLTLDKHEHCGWSWSLINDYTERWGTNKTIFFKFPNCSCVELLLLKTLTTFSIKMPAFNSFNRLSENIINKFLLCTFFTVTFLFLLFYIGNNLKDIDQHSSLLHWTLCVLMDVALSCYCIDYHISH